MQPTKKKTVVSVRDKLDGNEIDLSLLELSDVPVRELAQVTRGTKLDLSNNKLVTLTVAFPTLTHLVELDLSKNQLKELPVNFGDLRNLRKLDLYSNQLQRLPVSFHQLKELRWLDLKNNPLVSTLAEAAGDCLDQKGCQAAAKKVVNLMTVVHAELEKKRLKEQEESKAEAARKNEEERAREQQARAEKKAEKGKRRAEATSAKQQSEAMANKVQADNKPRADDVKNGKKGQKQSQRQQQQPKKAVQGQSFCARFFVILLRLLFLAALVFTVIFALNWKGPLTLDNTAVVARRSVDQVVRQSQEAYEWAHPRLAPVREQWKQLTRFVSDNGRDLIYIAWDKTVHYGQVVKQQAIATWPVIQERASDAAGLAAHYWRIACQEAPVYYQSVVDKLFPQEQQPSGPAQQQQTPPTNRKGA